VAADLDDLTGIEQVGMGRLGVLMVTNWGIPAVPWL